MIKLAIISEKLWSWMWKILLILAVAVPIVALVFFWHQNNFEMPMPKAVLNSVTANPLVFSVFIVLIAASFAMQYFFGSPATKKHEIRLRTPILVFIGPIVVIIISALAWWQSGASFTTIVSEVAQKTLVLGTVMGLTVGSFLLAFVVSPREEQRRCFKVLVTLASVFLMLGGPSYLTYGLQTIKVPYSFATLIGLVSFLVGIVLFLRFVVKGVKT
jgi:hypothetical protein